MSESNEDAAPALPPRQSTAETGLHRTDEGDGGGTRRDRPIETFEDLMEIVGYKGRWNIRIIVMCCFCSFVTPFSSMSYQFFGYTPNHWCKVNTLIQANWTQQQIMDLAIPYDNETGEPSQCYMYNYNYSEAVILGYDKVIDDTSLISNGNAEIIQCSSRIYNTTAELQDSIVTEWDLTCDRRILFSTTQAVTQIGTLIGSIFYGYLLDWLGRRNGVIFSSITAVITSLLLIASPDIDTYLALKLIYQIVDLGFYMGCLILAMEVCSPSQRTDVGSLFALPWALGYMLVPSIAYVVRQWRWLQATYTIPLLYTLIYCWAMPESPRWLINKGDFKRALKVLKKAATTNKKTLPSDEIIMQGLKNIRMKEDAMTDSESEPKNCCKKVMDNIFLMLNAEVRSKAFIVFYLWAATTAVYYGISLNAYNLRTNIYIYTFLGALLEIPAYFLLWVATSNVGRKRTLIFLYFLCFILTIILTALLLTMDQVPMGARFFLSLGSKMCITAAFQLIWFYTTELFSTKYRARATGEASMFGRIGSITSPYINDILGMDVTWGPSLVFAITVFIGGVLVFFLPETSRTHMTLGQKHQDREQREQEHGGQISIPLSHI